MTLTRKHIEDVCLLWHANPSKTCRHIIADELDSNKWYCNKLRPNANDSLLLNSSSMPLARGDNCNGYPLLKHIEQGFDVD